MKALVLIAMLVAGGCFMGSLSSCRRSISPGGSISPNGSISPTENMSLGESNAGRVLCSNDSSLHLSHDTLFADRSRFTGTLLTLATNGDTLSENTYVNGLLDGTSREYYSGHKLRTLRYFRAGRHEGVHKGWWPNGNPMFVYSYHKDLMQDSAVEWRQEGTLFRVAHYVDGREQGLETEWNQDGTLFANYEARDGRKYGLTGVRQCETPAGVKE